MRPENLLRLQGHYGNRAVRGLIARKVEEGSGKGRSSQDLASHSQTVQVSQAPAGRIQRASTTGMAASSVVGNLAKEANKWWWSSANGKKPLTALTDFLMEKANEKLSYPCGHEYRDSGDTGTFNRLFWTVKINTAKFSKKEGVSKVNDLNINEVSEIVDTILHEVRHSEQYFRIARMQAGEGKSPEQIMTNIEIPAEVARAAAADPLKPTSKANKALIEEAKGWEAFSIGKYKEYKLQMSDLRDEIDDMRGQFGAGSTGRQLVAIGSKLDAIELRLNAYFASEKMRIEGLPDKDAADESVLAHIDEIRAAYLAFKLEYNRQMRSAGARNLPRLKKLGYALYKARYSAYRDYMHEKDAWEVGAAAAKSFKEQPPPAAVQKMMATGATIAAGAIDMAVEGARFFWPFSKHK